MPAGATGAGEHRRFLMPSSSMSRSTSALARGLSAAWGAAPRAGGSAVAASRKSTGGIGGAGGLAALCGSRGRACCGEANLVQD